jgi:hypothetical protein
MLFQIALVFTYIFSLQETAVPIPLPSIISQTRQGGELRKISCLGTQVLVHIAITTCCVWIVDLSLSLLWNRAIFGWYLIPTILFFASLLNF